MRSWAEGREASLSCALRAAAWAATGTASGYGEKEWLCCSPVSGKAWRNRPAINQNVPHSHLQKPQRQRGEMERWYCSEQRLERGQERVSTRVDLRKCVREGWAGTKEEGILMMKMRKSTAGNGYNNRIKLL